MQSDAPHNIELEQALLGGVIWHNEIVDIVEGKLSEADFFEPLHRRIWSVFSEARRSGRRIDTKLAASALGSDAKEVVVDGVTVGQYVARLATDAVPVVSCRDYAAGIRELADMRRIVEVADRLKAGSANAGAIQPADLARESIEALDAIVACNTDTAAPRVSAGEAARSALERMVHTRESGRSIVGAPYGLARLDAATLGLAKGEMILVGARPSVGKTAFAVSVARAAAEAGHGVIYFSLEMYGDALMERAMADIVYNPRQPITYRQIRAGKVTDAEVDRLASAASHLNTIPLVIEQEPGLTAGQIVARSRKFKAHLEQTPGPKLDLVIVDHVHLVQSSGRYAGKRTDEVTEISGALKGLAKQLGVAILVLCQLNRGNEGRENKRPQLSDLRDSGALEQDADVVMFLHRDEYYLERQKGKDDQEEMERTTKLDARKNILEIAIAKQRQGPIAIIDAFCDIGCNAIRNLAE